MHQTQRNTVIPAVFLLLKRGNEIFLQRRFNTGFQDGQYTLISGHVDKGEPPTVATCREAKEEAGIIVLEKHLNLEQVLYRRGFDRTGDGFDHAQAERVDFFFSAETWEGEPRIAEPDKCDKVGWFPIDALPENLFPIVRAFLKDFPNPPFYKHMGY
jgi:8-oxo-dGTP diphosphatase